jgi:hypothetical protein
MRCRRVEVAGVGCLSLDVRALVFNAGGAVSFAWAAVLARVFMAGPAAVVRGGAGSGGRRFFLRLVKDGFAWMRTGPVDVETCFDMARVTRCVPSTVGATLGSWAFIWSTLGSAAMFCFVLCWISS